MKLSHKIVLLLVFVGGVMFLSDFYQLGDILTLSHLKSQRSSLLELFATHPTKVMGFYLASYIVVTALSLPGAAILTLAGGAIFGFWKGTLLVSFASTCGATLAFLSSRLLFRESVQKKFKDRLSKINEGISSQGAFYLFTLRLVPLFPFFLINLLMGLTPISVGVFFLVSQLGMLPGTMAFVYAGTELGSLHSLSDVLSPTLWFSFFLLAAFPFLARKVLEVLQRYRVLGKYKKPKNFDYNLVVIGGGSAGLVSSYIASAVKAKVALVEKHRMGGDCLNTGCVPSKALIKSAKVASQVRHATNFGLKGRLESVELEKIMDRVSHIIKKIEPHDSIQRYTALGVQCFEGEAIVRSPFEVEVNGKILTTKNIILAMGARPRVPSLDGIEAIDYLTSDNIWNLKQLPGHLLVLGGGPIGCEIAQCFARLGSQVTQVERNGQIMGREDEEVASFIQQSLEADGVQVLTEHQARGFEKRNGQDVLLCEHQGEQKQIPFDRVFLALGREAQSDQAGVGGLPLQIMPQGTMAHDLFLRTSIPNIYVCGDLAGPYQFTHTAAHQAWFASVNALFSPFWSFKVDYRVIPWCTFTDPEVARVGLSENEAKEKEIAFEVTRYELDELDRAICEGEARGFVKVITPKGSDKILGATLVGAHAGEMIGEFVLAMKYGLGMNKLLGTIHIYPTLNEANKYVAGNWKKNHAPQKLLEFVQKFHTWRRS